MTVDALERDPIDAAVREELGALFAIEVLHRRGPASVVYIAQDLECNHRVALKVMPRSPQAGDLAQEGFNRGAAAAAALEHRLVVPIYSAGTTDRLLWCASQYVPGHSLAELLRQSGPLDLPACTRLVQQVASALDHAHQRGLVHADLKPGNVLIDAAGSARVTDFWVPRVLEQLGALGGGRPSARAVDYLAPEDLSGGEPGPAADQYSLALLAFECLSGSLPFSGDTVEAIAQPVRTEPPPRLADVRPGTPDSVSTALERALSKAPAARFAGVLDFAAAWRTAGPPAAAAPLPPRVTQLQATFESMEPAQAARRRARKRHWLLVGALGSAIGGASWAVLVLSSGPPSPPPVAAAPPEPVAAHADSLLALARRALPDRAPPARAPVSIGAAPRRTAAQRPGRLFINATPWGEVYIDGALVGNTPKADVPVAPGPHRLRVVRDGFQPFDATIRVESGRELRLTDIVLSELKP